MVTGDQLAIAVETCRRLNMGTNIMEGKELMYAKDGDNTLASKVDKVDGFAGVYPEHKYKIVEALQSAGRLVGMTGDGVNDAPALKKANVGIAVADATDAAKGAADIILTEEGIGTIITAIVQSRMIFRRLETYIIYRMASSLTILMFFFFAVIILAFTFPTWTLVLLSLTNDLSAMATSFDRVYSSEFPELWNMTKCLFQGVRYACVVDASSARQGRRCVHAAFTLMYHIESPSHHAVDRQHHGPDADALPGPAQRHQLVVHLRRDAVGQRGHRRLHHHQPPGLSCVSLFVYSHSPWS